MNTTRKLPSLTGFIDTHTHIDFEEFDLDRAEVWARCKLLGVNAAIIPGVSIEQWPTAAAISRANTGLFYAVGLHPFKVGEFCSAKDVSANKLNLLYDQLSIAAKNDKCVAIGECGLDKFIDIPLSTQQQILEVHLAVANELSLPVIIHSRKTHNEIMACIKAQSGLSKAAAGGVIHAFSGSIELAMQYVDLGFYLGIGGTITYERANKTRNAATLLPLQYMVLETDSPDMPLKGKQGMRNSPEYIPEIATALAGLRRESIEQIAQQTTANACKLFSL